MVSDEPGEVHVQVDLDACVGAGQCVRFAPDVFDQNTSDGTAVVLDEHPPARLFAQVREAAAMCPASAVLLED